MLHRGRCTSWYNAKLTLRSDSFQSAAWQFFWLHWVQPFSLDHFLLCNLCGRLQQYLKEQLIMNTHTEHKSDPDHFTDGKFFPCPLKTRKVALPLNCTAVPSQEASLPRVSCCSSEYHADVYFFALWIDMPFGLTLQNPGDSAGDRDMPHFPFSFVCS